MASGDVTCTVVKNPTDTTVAAAVTAQLAAATDTLTITPLGLDRVLITTIEQ